MVASWHLLRFRATAEGRKETGVSENLGPPNLSQHNWIRNMESGVQGSVGLGFNHVVIPQPPKPGSHSSHMRCIEPELTMWCWASVYILNKLLNPIYHLQVLWILGLEATGWGVHLT